MIVTHSVGPVGEIPVGDTGSHVTFFTSLRSLPGVALLFVHYAAFLTNTPDAPCPPPDATVHRALQ